MLLEFARTDEGAEQAKTLWEDMRIRRIRNGRKDITVENFLAKHMVYIHYRVGKRYYKGFFNKQEEDNIFRILDYFEGKIIALNG